MQQLAKCFLFALLGFAWGGAARAQSYYVAPGGADANPGTLAQPWRTIQKAASVAQAGATVYIRGGTYRETVTPVNSGASGNPITYQNYSGETVTVSGADVVAGPWTPEGGNSYALMGWTLGAENQVFADGQMLYLARYPNKTDTDLFSTNGLNYLDAGTDNSITDAPLAQAADYWKGGVVWMLNGLKWTAYGAKITGSSGSTISFNAPAYWHDHSPQSQVGDAGNVYYIAGLLSQLDYANEWYYDGTSGRLYVHADPAGKTIEAKRRLYAFDVNNKSYITIKGIRTFAASIRLAGSHNTLDGISAEYLYHHSGEGMDYAFPGSVSYPGNREVDKAGDGIRLIGDYNTVKNSQIRYSAGYGIVSDNGIENRIDNNEVLYTDYLGNYDTGIACYGSTNNYITRNKVWYSAGPGITMSAKPSGYKGNFVLYNDIGYAELFGDDRGGINGSGGEIAYNWIHNIGRDWAKGLTPGLYSDDGSNYALWHHNVVYDNAGADGIGRNGRVGSARGTVKFYNNTGYNLPSNTEVALHGESHDAMNPEVKNGYLNAAAGNFAGASGKDYRLAGGATAINAGAVISPITDGYVTTPDLGAYEFGGADKVSNWQAGLNVTMYYVPSPAVSGGNAVDNPSFEADNAAVLSPQAWSTGADADADYTEANGGAHTGTYHGTHYKASAYEVYTYQTVPGLANGTYTVTAWVKSTGGQTTCVLLAKNYGGAQLQTSIGAASDWTLVTVPNVQVSNGQCEVGFYSKAGAGQYLFFDDVQLAPATPALANPSFEADNAAVQAPQAWSTWPGVNGTDADADYTEANGGAHAGAYHGTHYKASAYEVYTSQLVTGLANGAYSATAWVRSSGGQTTCQFDAKNFGGNHPTVDIAAAADWTRITLPNVVVANGQCELGFYSVAGAGQYLYFDDVALAPATGARGVALAQTSATEASYLHFAAYPNPAAGGMVTVRFTPRQSGPVALTLYDRLGRAVRELHRGEGPAGLEQRVLLQARDFTDGLYLLRLTTAGETSSQKLLLQR